ncbi:MAG: heme-binding protein [Betaproteobacteria bacterium]
MKRLIGLFVLTIGIYGGHVMATEEPRFVTLEKEGNFEIRQYDSQLIAEVYVEGDMGRSGNKGFRMIADFIFGNNEKVDANESQKIAMTAPVTLEPQKIAMTAPVTLEGNENNQWRVQFTMPSQYTFSTLPRPKNPDVKIREIPGRKMAVISFSGYMGEEKSLKKTDELLGWMAHKGYKTIGRPQMASYNPPWTLPFWRRNEVQIEIANHD